MKHIGIVILGLVMMSCTTHAQKQEKLSVNKVNEMTTENIEYATFGGGCFWCVEAIFEQLEGVQKVESGYSGGHVKNPSYKAVTTGKTGHTEVIHITYNPKVIDFNLLLEVFFNTHNPTTLNQQGADRGTQYRSAIFYHNDRQKEVANAMINAFDEEEVFEDKIVTEVTEFDIFYVAEDYHQDYYNKNSTQGYCQVVINPKLEKFQKMYKEKLKKK
ncbi:MAG: peptide-methionine (S)-S-oxide reductase MsrA [Flavobacteriaceae bacterium]|nr:peptide-methionine (S)-S-oxide reductase MsrA [Flavobacteriaceae bacterium]